MRVIINKLLPQHRSQQCFSPRFADKLQNWMWKFHSIIFIHALGCRRRLDHWVMLLCITHHCLSCFLLLLLIFFDYNNSITQCLSCCLSLLLIFLPIVLFILCFLRPELKRIQLALPQLICSMYNLDFIAIGVILEYVFFKLAQDSRSKILPSEL